MKKLIITPIIVFVISMWAFAQTDKKFSFSAGPEVSFAVGSFSNTHSVGLGGTVQAEYSIMEKLKGTATFGWLAYLAKSSGINIDKEAQRIVPLRVGAKYFLIEGLYAGAQLGVAFFSNYAPYSGTGFAYSPLMLGYEYKLKSGKAFDATIKYDAYTGAGNSGTLGAFGLRLAYVF